MTKFEVGVATDVGQVRQVNQDNTLVAEDIFAVADGMGGHRGGEVASLVAVEALQAAFLDRTTDALVDAVQYANEAIVDRAKEDPDLRGMGTTMSALARVYLDDGEEILTVVNVGDSRAYLLKAGEDELVQISEDHSLVQTLFRQGQLTQAEAAVHPQRNILTRALGIDQKVLPDSFDLLPVKGDRYLLCSDGLFNEVDEPRMAQILRELTDPQAAADELVRLANEGGGRDNISVVVVDVTDDAGHHKVLEGQSDDHRVVHAVRGPERVGLPPEDGPAPAAQPAAVAVAAGSVTTLPPDGVAPVGGSTVIDPTPVGGDAYDPAVTGARAGVVVSGGSAMAAAPAPAMAAPPPVPVASVAKSRFTWRVGAFILIFVGVLAVGAFAVNWYATNSYFVGVKDGQVVIFQGRPGGFLWYQPTVAQSTGIGATAVPAEQQADIVAGKTEPSLEAAVAFVANLASSATTPTTTPPISLPAAGGSTSTSEQPGGTTTTTESLGGHVIGELSLHPAIP